MPRRALVAAGLAVLIALGGGLPTWVGQTAAASCSNWTSQSDPPPTIRVFRHATGAVETVDFRAYTKNVLSREWIGSWTTESLRSGALAVKHYAWYQVLHWRGWVNSAGACFDVRDDTYDQVYDPTKATWNSAAAAVDATWSTRVLRNGSIFPTYYNAGAANEACGMNTTGWKLWQWGSQACGLAGKTAAQIILIYYYPGVTVSGAPAATASPVPTASASSTLPPTATPSPVPTATPAPTPATASTPSPTATPMPPTPTPSPTPSPIPTPAPGQQMPGGGQTAVAGAAAPPAPPAVDPSPVVVQAGDSTSLATFRQGAATDIAGFVTEVNGPDPRLAGFRTQWGAAAERLLTDLTRRFAAGGGLVLRFPTAS